MANERGGAAETVLVDYGQREQLRTYLDKASGGNRHQGDILHVQPLHGTSRFGSQRNWAGTVSTRRAHLRWFGLG